MACFLVFATAGVVVFRPGPDPRHQVVIPPGDPVEALRAVPDSIVQLGGKGCGGLHVGTGFAVGDALVATNAHVVAGIPRLEIDPLGRAHRSAQVVAFDPVDDLALVRVTGLDVPALTLSSQGATETERVASAGFGGSRELVTKAGTVSNRQHATITDIFDRARHGVDLIQLRLKTRPGDSGSPVVDPAGQVVGVIEGGPIDGREASIAVDVPALRRLVETPTLEDGSLTCPAGRFRIEWGQGA